MPRHPVLGNRVTTIAVRDVLSACHAICSRKPTVAPHSGGARLALLPVELPLHVGDGCGTENAAGFEACAPVQRIAGKRGGVGGAARIPADNPLPDSGPG